MLDLGIFAAVTVAETCQLEHQELLVEICKYQQLQRYI